MEISLLIQGVSNYILSSSVSFQNMSINKVSNSNLCKDLLRPLNSSNIYNLESINREEEKKEESEQ